MTKGLYNANPADTELSVAHRNISYLDGRRLGTANPDVPLNTSFFSDPGLIEYSFAETSKTNSTHNLTLNDKTSQNKIGIVDLRGQTLHIKQAQKISEISHSEKTSVLFILDEKVPATIASILARHNHIYCGTLHTKGLANQLRNIFRKQTIIAEMERRKHVLNATTNEHSAIDYNNNMTILVAGPPGHHVLPLINSLEAAGYTVQCTYRPGQTMRALETDEINGIVIFPSEKGDPLLALARSMRRHTRHQTIPVIVAARDQEQAAIFDHDGLIIHHNHINETGAAIIDSEIRREKRIHIAKQYLRTGGIPEARDQKAHIFSPKVFARWLSATDNDGTAHSTLKNFVAFRLTSHASIDISTRNMINQAGPLVNRVIRVEDFTALLSANNNSVNCAIGVNDCSQANINRIAGRIMGVIRSTMFHDNLGNPVPLSIEAKAFRRENGLCIEETFAGLLGGIRQQLRSH